MEDIVTNAKAMATQALEKFEETPTELQVGAVLFGVMMITVWLGDEFWVPAKKKATAGLATTAVIRPLATLLFAAWLEIYCLVTWLSNPIGQTIFAGLVTVALAICLFDIKYRPLPFFEGIDITVRQPNNKKHSFAEMDYTMDPTDLGTYSTVCMFFWFAASALIVIFEACIHVLMGVDAERINDEGSNVTSCEGMMAQELVHCKAQMLYSRTAERTYNYPPGYRKIWKFVLLTLFPQPIQRAFVCYFEAGFVPLTRFNSYSTDILEKYIHYKPKWLWTWHFMEEAEHSWDSVQNELEHTNIFTRTLFWFLGCFLMPLMMVFLPPVECLLYGKRALFRNPQTFVLSIITFVTVMPLLCTLYIMACLFHTVLFMRPDDDFFVKVDKIFKEKIYKPEYKKLFRETHTQHPHEHLHMRKSFMLEQNGGGSSRRASLFGSIASASKETAADMTSEKKDAVRRLSSYRASLYESVRKELTDAGMSAKEIEQSCLHIDDPSTLKKLIIEDLEPKKSK